MPSTTRRGGPGRARPAEAGRCPCGASPEQCWVPEKRRRIRMIGARLKWTRESREAEESCRRVQEGGCAMSVRPPLNRLGHTPTLAALPMRTQQAMSHGLSLNPTRPGVALGPGPTSHMPWASPGAPESPAPLVLPSRPANTLKPASTLHAGEHVEVERPPQQLCPVHSRRPLLHPLLPRRCLNPRARFLRTCLGERAPGGLRGSGRVSSPMPEPRLEHRKSWQRHLERSSLIAG